MDKEYGGYLPLELRKGEEYFSDFPFRRFNCGKAALNFVLTEKTFSKIYVPYYLCPNVCKEIESHSFDICYYHINDNLLPDEISDEDGVCIYIVDYFGVIDNAVTELVNSIKNAAVIIDFCHSFFHKPILREKVYNIYSAKKFFGVPDGAYLIAENLTPDSGELSYSSDYSSYLIQSLEHGTNYCYLQKKEADKLIGSNYGAMSVLAKRILEGIDYQGVREIRKQNCEIFSSYFSGINRIKVENNSSPYMYPLNVGKNIKKELVSEKIYVPTLWGQLLDDRFKGTIEYELSDKTLFLPVDQRYSKHDIDYIASIVNKYI